MKCRTPEISVAILILEIRVSVEDHQRTLALECSHKLCYTHVRGDADQHMNVIWAGFRLDDLHLHLITQLSQDFSYVLLDLVVYYLSAIFRCKHHMILAAVT